MPPIASLAVAGIRNPRDLAGLSLREWDLCLRQARVAGVLGSLQARLTATGLLEAVPAVVRDHLQAARALADAQQRSLYRELRCIRQALAGVCEDFVLLKGSAYVVAGLPHAAGRRQSDVDILVPAEAIGAVEQALIAHGWQGLKLEDYDQYYYRKWSHELPPLVHKERGTVIDVHHTILPVMGRLRPDARKLWMASRAIAGTPYRRLDDADMVLHAAAHMFQDGEFSQGLRELADLDGLLRAFGTDEAFWRRLSVRAPEMQLQRPLFYALRYCSHYLDTPIPAETIQASAAWRPPAPALAAMDALVGSVMSFDPHRPSAGRLAHLLLYMRSHWLRMPPWLLVRHLLHQFWSRNFRKKGKDKD